MGFLIICSDRINEFLPEIYFNPGILCISTKIAIYYTTKGRGGEEILRENPVQKTTFGKYQNTFSPTHYNQRSDERRRGFGGYFMRLLWLL